MGSATVVRLDDVGSTNDEALARFDGEQPLWVISEQQTAGRGRRGREWVSEQGNLYASFAFANRWPAETFALLPLAAAFAVAKLLEGFGLEPRLKWPNDVLIDRKKVCGILIESAFSGPSRTVVMGFGLNVVRAPEGATSLVEHRPSTTYEEAFAGLRHTLAETLGALEAPTGRAEIRRLWLRRAVGVGGLITVRFDKDAVDGRFEGLDADGRLILATPTGTRLIAAGDVFVRTEKV